MLLTTEEVRKIATLARIDLTDAEVEKFQKELSVVLDYVSELNEVNTDGIEEVSQVTGLENVERNDEAEGCPYRQEIIDNFPERKDDFLKIKSIL